MLEGPLSSRVVAVDRARVVQDLPLFEPWTRNKAESPFRGFPDSVIIYDPASGRETPFVFEFFGDFYDVGPRDVGVFEHRVVGQIFRHLFLVPTFAHDNKSMWGTIIKQEY